jgi:hypothetical protein
VAIDAGAWHCVAAVKRGGTLILYLDGKQMGTASVPEFITTSAHDCALGGNPHFSGNEFLDATFSEFGFWARAFSEAELKELCKQHQPK